VIDISLTMVIYLLYLLFYLIYFKISFTFRDITKCRLNKRYISITVIYMSPSLITC